MKNEFQEEPIQWFIKGSKEPIPEDVCKAHTEPSPQTVEELTGLKVNFARMEGKIDNVVELLKEVKETKADKWVEKAMVWLIASTIGLDFVVLGSLIIRWIKKQ